MTMTKQESKCAAIGRWAVIFVKGASIPSNAGREDAGNRQSTASERASNEGQNERGWSFFSHRVERLSQTAREQGRCRESVGGRSGARVSRKTNVCVCFLPAPGGDSSGGVQAVDGLLVQKVWTDGMRRAKELADETMRRRGGRKRRRGKKLWNQRKAFDGR